MKKILTNNILLKILSLLFAILLWLVVVNIDDPTVSKTIYGIPVVIQNEDVLTAQSQVYEVTSGDSATIVIKGPRSCIDKMTKDDFVAEASFSEMSNVFAVPITVKHRYAKYEKSVDITQKTTTMTLEVEDIITRTYEIQIKETGSMPTGYMMGSESVVPTTVEVSAPESVINQISKAVVEVNLGKYNKTESVSLPIYFYTDTGSRVDLGTYAKLSVETAVISMNVFSVKEVPLKFSTVGTPKDGYSLTDVECDVQTVKIAGNNVSDIDSITIPSDVLDVEGKSTDVNISIDISGYLPEGVILYNDENAKVNVVAKIEKLVVKKFKILTKDIEVKNLPAGYRMSYTDGNAITVQLRGLSGVLDSFSEDSLAPYIDLRDATEGQNVVTVNVTLSDNITEVAVPTVGVTLEKESGNNSTEHNTENSNTTNGNDADESTAQTTTGAGGNDSEGSTVAE